MALSRETRVGGFVLAGLIVAGFIIFLIGDERRAFAPKRDFHVSFRDVQGLKIGAPVRLGGVDIGSVAKVAHSDDPRDDRLYVTLHIVGDEAGRIRDDTLAKVANKGLLGDKMIELAGGTAGHAVVPPGGTIQGQDPSDLSNLVGQVGSMTEHAQRILENLEVTSKSLSDEQLHRDLQGSARSMQIVLRSVAEGDGYVHRLLSDPKEADRLSHLVGTLDHAATELDATLTDVHALVARVEKGPGFAHEALYGESGKQALEGAGQAATELATALKGIREGDGLARALLYGGPGPAANLVTEAAAASADLHGLLADVRAGKGTLGALLVDPSVYEDVKRVLGDVERNDVLRALVRYSIKQDEKKPTARVPQGASPRPAP